MVGSKQIHLEFILCAFFLLCWNPTPVRAEGYEYDFKRGSKKGPERWGDLQQEWKACKTGKSQSPIDLRDEVAHKGNSTLVHFQMNYKPTKAILKNEGHAIVISWEGDAGTVNINGTVYILRQGHWHAPAEHTINGKRYDLALHMVHQNPDPEMKINVAVVAYLFNIGNPNPFLSKVNEGLKSMVDTKKVELGVIDPSEIIWTSLKFYRYVGSLTTPPCTEGVIWTVNEKVNTVSREQVELLKQAVADYAAANARPLQRLNDRDITVFGP